MKLDRERITTTSAHAVSASATAAHAASIVACPVSSVTLRAKHVARVDLVVRKKVITRLSISLSSAQGKKIRSQQATLKSS